jgi:hypothetical protein
MLDILKYLLYQIVVEEEAASRTINIYKSSLADRTLRRKK